MIHRQRLLEALQEKAQEFERFGKMEQGVREQHRTLLARFSSRSYEAHLQHLTQGELAGAIPLDEFETFPSMCVPFSRQFRHHQDARAWAAERLTGTTTFAVDGSQVMPTKELSVPVAVVQAGWFRNPHRVGVPFEKNVHTEVLGPQELLESGSQDKLFHEQSISLRRFELEMQTLQRFCCESYEENHRPLAFFDGSLLISFAEVLLELYRARYLQAAVQLLEASEKNRVPVVGYVDTSVARDVIRMLRKTFFDDPSVQQDGLRDALLLDELLPHWGDRTIAFRLDRPGILRQYENAGGGLGCVYMRTTMGRPPTRIEFPLWMYHEDCLDDALDLLRAEVIIGNGYPYALETADEIAWFSPIDRSRFTRMLRDFLAQNEVALEISGKLQSKQRRR